MHNDPLRRHGGKERSRDKKEIDLVDLVKDIEAIKSLSDKFTKK